MKPVFLRLLFLTPLVMAGCGRQPTYTPYASTPRAAPAEDKEVVAARDGHRPVDYKKQVDGFFVGSLKDPDSRKVVFNKVPYGGLVCGTVNAKNSYGGYTGAQPFYAIFDPSQKLITVLPFDDKAVSMWRRSGFSLGDIGYEYHKLLSDCGVF